jgi:RimJ/RimL family protein N-acetyltransferase
MSEGLETFPLNREIGKGLTMRQLETRDSDRIAEILRWDPLIKTVVTWTAHINSPDDVPRAMAEYRARGGTQLGFERDGVLDVYTGILPVTFSGRERDYGFGYFSAQECRRRGLAREAMEATIEYAREAFRPTSLALYIADWNNSSQQVADRLGFEKTDEVFMDPILECEERRWERLP